MRLLAWGSHPARFGPLAYAAVWLAGTALLLLPAATAPARATGWWEASFTAMSALCITGLVVVDTATHWSLFGHVVILLLIHLGGFGIVTLTTLLVVGVARRRASLRQTLGAAGETRTRSLGDLRQLPVRILVGMVSVEALVAVVLALRFRAYTDSWLQAAWYGVFHAVSASNNTGFGLYSANLIDFNADPWIMVPICAAVTAGGMGFPVYSELARRFRTRAAREASVRGWIGSATRALVVRRGQASVLPVSVHARITLWGSLALFAIGFLTFAVWEWSNPATLGGASPSGKVLGALGGAVFPRTAGFNSIDYEQAASPTLFVNYLLMFVGGGSAGTAGGLKVSTMVVLLAVVWAEVRGDERTVLAGRTLSPGVVRQALALVTVSLVVVALAVLVIQSVTDAPLRAVMFECFSAFGTVGLSMNLTPTLPPAALAVLTVLMYLGRVGVLAFVAALALRPRHRLYQLPEEDPLVG